MIAPLLVTGSGVVAIPIGIAFGAALERAGLGSAKTIAGQLTGREFTVVKVMFSAIVTAMLGIFWATRLGWLDLARVDVPETDILPQLIGAVLFGAGFAIASLCPGTACVAVGSGHRDGFATVGGLFLGTLVTAELWPRLGAVAESAPRDARLPADLGLPVGAVVGLITLMAVVTIYLSTRRENAATYRPPARREGRIVLATAAVTLGAIAALAGNPAGASPETLTSIASEISREADHVDAIDLATWLHDGKAGLRIIDVRDDIAPGRYQIPGAESIPLPEVPKIVVNPGETVVLYSDGGAHAAQAWVLLRTRGVRDVYVLHDGLAAWEDDVLRPHLPASEDSASLDRYRRALVLAAWLDWSHNTAAPAPPPVPGSPFRPAPAPKRLAPPRRRHTC